MQVELGPRSTQDLIDGIARHSWKRTPALDNAKGTADALANENRLIIVGDMAAGNERLPEDHPHKMTPSELNARINDVPTNSRFFRRQAGLRGDDAKPEKDAV